MDSFSSLLLFHHAMKNAAAEINHKLTDEAYKTLERLHSSISDSEEEFGLSNDDEELFESFWSSSVPKMKFVVAEPFEIQGKRVWHTTYALNVEEYLLLVTINFSSNKEPKVSHHRISMDSI